MEKQVLRAQQQLDGWKSCHAPTLQTLQVAKNLPLWCPHLHFTILGLRDL